MSLKKRVQKHWQVLQDLNDLVQLTLPYRTACHMPGIPCHPKEPCSYLPEICTLFRCCLQCPSLTSLPQEELLLESLDLPGGAYPGNRLIPCALPEAGAPYIYGSTYHTALVTLALSVLFPMSLNF